jgi:hypothetical protein
MDMDFIAILHPKTTQYVMSARSANAFWLQGNLIKISSGS